MQLMSIKIGLLSVLLLKTCVRKKGGLGGFAPQTLTRFYYFEPPLSKKRSRATGCEVTRVDETATTCREGSGVRTGEGGSGVKTPPIEDFIKNENLSFWNEPPFFIQRLPK